MTSTHHNYYTSQHPARPSERMDSYFPPLSNQVEHKAISKRNSFNGAFTQPSRRTISAAKFQRHSRARSEGEASGSGSQDDNLIPPQPFFSRSEKNLDAEIHDEFTFTLQGKRSSIVSTSSPLRQRSLLATKMTRSSQVMPSLSSHFSDDESDSSDEEVLEENNDLDFEGESSLSNSTSRPSPTHQLTSFTPPKTDNEVESMIHNFAILMRSSSQRQRLASVHLDAQKPTIKRRAEQVRISKSDDEENRRGRHLDSHWWHEHEEQRSPLGQHFQTYH